MELIKALKSIESTRPILEKWQQSGMLCGLKGKKKLNVAKSFELAAQIIIADGESEKSFYKERISTLIFACIRRVFDEVHSKFMFDEEKMVGFISFINECADIKKYQKYLKNIDAEAEICAFLSSVYVLEQNAIIKKK